MKIISWMLVGSVLGLLGALMPGCGSPSQVCGPSNCAGCCDARGRCELGMTQDACGTRGAACTACAATQSCVSGSCVSGSGHPGEDGGSGADGGPEIDGGVLSIDAFTEENFRAACEVWVRCGYVSSIDACSGWYLDRFRASRASTVQDEKAAVEAGRMLFHPDKARACLDAIQSAACPDHASSLSLLECDQVFEGQVPTNGNCYTAEECGAADWCASSGSLCPGQCKPRKTWGQTVDPWEGEACAEGLYPYYPGDGTYLCRSPDPVGSICASKYVEMERCVDSAYCDQVSGRCLVKKALGAACRDDIECAAGLVCQSGTCGPLARQGESCSSSPETRCQDDLTCYRSDPGTDVGTCSAPGSAGAPCSNIISGCLPGLYCAGYSYSPPGNGSCTANKAPGATCTDHWECGPSAYCSSSGVCTADKPDGSACAESYECLGGDCNSGTCTSYFCHAPLP